MNKIFALISLATAVSCGNLNNALGYQGSGVASLGYGYSTNPRYHNHGLAPGSINYAQHGYNIAPGYNHAPAIGYNSASAYAGYSSGHGGYVQGVGYNTALSYPHATGYASPPTYASNQVKTVTKFNLQQTHPSPVASYNRILNYGHGGQVGRYSSVPAIGYATAPGYGSASGYASGPGYASGSRYASTANYASAPGYVPHQVKTVTKFNLQQSHPNAVTSHAFHQAPIRNYAHGLSIGNYGSAHGNTGHGNISW